MEWNGKKQFRNVFLLQKAANKYGHLMAVGKSNNVTTKMKYFLNICLGHFHLVCDNLYENSAASRQTTTEKENKFN